MNIVSSHDPSINKAAVNKVSRSRQWPIMNEIRGRSGKFFLIRHFESLSLGGEKQDLINFTSLHEWGQRLLWLFLTFRRLKKFVSVTFALFFRDEQNNLKSKARQRETRRERERDVIGRPIVKTDAFCSIRFGPLAHLENPIYSLGRQWSDFFGRLIRRSIFQDRLATLTIGRLSSHERPHKEKKEKLDHTKNKPKP